jgi:hypothetical protein
MEPATEFWKLQIECEIALKAGNMTRAKKLASKLMDFAFMDAWHDKRIHHNKAGREELPMLKEPERRKLATENFEKLNPELALLPEDHCDRQLEDGSFCTCKLGRRRLYKNTKHGLQEVGMAPEHFEPWKKGKYYQGIVDAWSAHPEPIESFAKLRKDDFTPNPNPIEIVNGRHVIHMQPAYAAG